MTLRPWRCLIRHAWVQVREYTSLGPNGALFPWRFVRLECSRCERVEIKQIRSRVISVVPFPPLLYAIGLMIAIAGCNPRIVDAWPPICSTPHPSDMTALMIEAGIESSPIIRV